MLEHQKRLSDIHSVGCIVDRQYDASVVHSKSSLKFYRKTSELKSFKMSCLSLAFCFCVLFHMIQVGALFSGLWNRIAIHERL